MIESLPKDIGAGLMAARMQAGRRRSRLHIELDGRVFRVLRLWHGGMALDAADLPRLRGLVDIYDGPRHILQCLIVTSSAENGELICDFKRSTPVSDHAPLDFWKDEHAPAGYLPKR